MSCFFRLRPLCGEYETLRAGKLMRCLSATRHSPVALGIVSGRINFRHQFPEGRLSKAAGRIVSRRPIGPFACEARRCACRQCMEEKPNRRRDAVLRCRSLWRRSVNSYTCKRWRNWSLRCYSYCIGLSRYQSTFTSYEYSRCLWLQQSVLQWPVTAAVAATVAASVARTKWWHGESVQRVTGRIEHWPTMRYDSSIVNNLLNTSLDSISPGI